MLNKKEIQELIERKKIVEGYINLEKQLTPNGIDLTAATLSRFSKTGSLDFSNKERVIPEAEEISVKKKNKEDKYGWWRLAPGPYKVKTNEIVNLADDLIALAFSRTSLLRIGCLTQHGVWDAGFSGKGEFILMVHNPAGVEIKENARLVQLVFYKIKQTEKYNGIHKNLT
ncbi:MAG: deoxyuridine 5'-triphosphate nucleotidohydrolase [Candidatus Omnitrophica bacterium]|nr:deoxyuridine 5'-triphosphate nucleotidohydrolase [Candidatus Omnitrophota bacterium]MCF7876881.1 deoxyuridine 5'-triphosphate nucleotidohydrolase [Candidatus Omnitrophota bacterium]MCF7877948.1 deoxyuridine 5'-triphosphate nucleotidohydrolase [Candidatus Omnitrophota bacterium]MCF7892695.1 deoxyuridine 5'-triphosphate nucleotidohydrolase [Candidatus Omnitrophota bacterium]